MNGATPNTRAAQRRQLVELMALFASEPHELHKITNEATVQAQADAVRAKARALPELQVLEAEARAELARGRTQGGDVALLAAIADRAAQRAVEAGGAFLVAIALAPAPTRRRWDELGASIDLAERKIADARELLERARAAGVSDTGEVLASLAQVEAELRQRRLEREGLRRELVGEEPLPAQPLSAEPSLPAGLAETVRAIESEAEGGALEHDLAVARRAAAELAELARAAGGLSSLESADLGGVE
jgi:hypothetical protein